MSKIRVQNTEVAQQVREMYQSTGYRLCIDADCPECDWGERWFDGTMFGCNKCNYRSQKRNA